MRMYVYRITYILSCTYTHTHTRVFRRSLRLRRSQSSTENCFELGPCKIIINYVQNSKARSPRVRRRLTREDAADDDGRVTRRHRVARWVGGGGRIEKR